MSWGRMLVLGPGSTIPAQVPGTSMKTFLYGSRLKCSPTKMKIGAKHFSVLLCWYSMSTQIFKRKSFMVDSLIVWGLLSPRPRTRWPSPSPTCLSQQHSVQEFKNIYHTKKYSDSLVTALHFFSTTISHTGSSCSTSCSLYLGSVWHQYSDDSEYYILQRLCWSMSKLRHPNYNVHLVSQTVS